MITEEKPRILITEDDFENQRFLDLFLRRKFTVELCDSEESFYEQLNSKKIDIILMDISLKGNKNGLELTQEIKKRPELSHIPVVCLTAHAFKKDRESALTAGVDVFLTKPVENEVLMNTLLEVLKNKKAEQV